MDKKSVETKNCSDCKSICWTPPTGLLLSSHMTKFAQYVAACREHPKVLRQESIGSVADYDKLYEYSIKYPHLFWCDIIQYCGIIYSEPPKAVLRHRDTLFYPVNHDEPPIKVSRADSFASAPKMDDFPEWFPGMRLNFAENLLKYAMSGKPEDVSLPAVFFASEDTPVRQVYNFGELLYQVKCAAQTLRSMGVQSGHTVAAYAAACPETVVMMLATAAIGAIWFSASPDFGVAGVLERLEQIKPKILFTVNGVLYNGKIHSNMEKVGQLLVGLLSKPECARELVSVVVLRFRSDCPMDLTFYPNSMSYEKFINHGQILLQSGLIGSFEFAQLPFNHPLYILFSSGTTGKPKGIVHSAGGTLVQHIKEHMVHGNLGKNDRVLQFTTTGWMMWQWVVSVIGTGAALVIYDGSPLKPRADTLLSVLADARVSAFGASPKYFAALSDAVSAGVCASPRMFNLSCLHSIYSTGSPLPAAAYRFVYSSFPSAPMLGSITGGTDIISLFIGHNTNLPVFVGQLQAPCLGMAVAAWDLDGKPVPRGHPGDLVCNVLFPCMPVSFWNDTPDHKLYRSAYFSKFPHVWAHGDFIKFCTGSRGVVMLGRSDGTLNPAGVRFGSADLYNIVEGFPEIADSLAVGQCTPDMHDERVCLFLMMNDGQKLCEKLKTRLITKIKTELSPRHVPSVILEIADIPYTINNKKVEVLVKRIISGERVVVSGTLRNPESIKLYMNIPELMRPKSKI